MQGLNRAGFSDKDYRIGSELPTPIPTPAPQQQTMDDIPQQPAEPDSNEEEFTGFNTSQVKERLEAGQQGTSSVMPDTVAEMAQQAPQQGEAFEAETQQAENMG